MPIRDIPLSGARVRVRTTESGARGIVFAVDPPNTLEMYGPLFARLKKHARVVAFEPPGFGGSRLMRGHGHDAATQDKLIIELLERLNLGPAVLAFPCLSAYAALRVAHARPDLVRGLVLIQAPSWGQEVAWADRVDAKGILRTPGVGQAAVLLRAESIARQWYHAAAADPKQAAHMAALATESISHGARFPLASAFQAHFRGAAPPVPTYDGPALAVWGPGDRSHKKSNPETIHEHAPRAELVTIADAGHFPELEAPEAFVKELVAWMDRHAL